MHATSWVPTASATSTLAATMRPRPTAPTSARWTPTSYPQSTRWPSGHLVTIGRKLGSVGGFDGDYGPLYRYGVNVLASHRPTWFLFENVGGIRGDGLNTVMEDFDNLGYRLYPHYYDFSDYGVPQKRKRVIIIGIREDCDVDFAVPAPFEADVSARTALHGISASATNNERARTNALTVERLNHIQPGQNAWTADLPEHLRINTKTTISSMYRRLAPEKPSYAVTGSSGGGYQRSARVLRTLGRR